MLAAAGSTSTADAMERSILSTSSWKRVRKLSDE
jgi:hypothetical protein